MTRNRLGAGILDVHGRHSMLSYFIFIYYYLFQFYVVWILRLINFTIDLIDYMMLLFLTQCYTQHALRPVIDSTINHVRHFIKIPFINKGMDFIDLPSTFRDKSVQSAVKGYFKNCEVPVIFINIINLL